MAKLEVIKYGHPTLRKIAEPVDAAEINQEFIDDMIEQRQQTVAENAGFQITDHNLNIYGLCRECQ